MDRAAVAVRAVVKRALNQYLGQTQATLLARFPRRTPRIPRRLNLSPPISVNASSSLPTPGAQGRGLSGSGNCAKAIRQIGRDFYRPEESEMLMGFPISWTEL